MKTKTLTKFAILPLFAMAVLSLSSCLKDPRYVDLSTGTPVVDMPLSGLAYFTQDAITKVGLDTLQFAVNLSSTNTSSSATQVVVGIDNTLIASYNAANTSVSFNAFPSNSYTFPDQTVTIPAGSREVYLKIVVNTAVLNPALSYMLPMAIKSATNGVTISGNFGVHYYHVIGNDFAGAYKWDWTRYNAPDSVSAPVNSLSFKGQTATIYGVTPTQFEVYGGYDGNAIRYEVTYTETGTYPNATYSNFAVTLNASDVSNAFGTTIIVTQQPVFLSPYYSPTGKYTFAQALQLLRFQYVVSSSGNPRYVIDKYYH